METPLLRETLALVFCDIAGTTQLIAEEGDLAVSALLRDFYEHSDRLSREHHCAFIKFIGDGFLAAFRDAGDVLPLAAAVQQVTGALRDPNRGPMGCKFSAHVGTVLRIETSYGQEVLGEDINFAARLNDLARPGQIVVSQALFDRLPVDRRATAEAGEMVQVKTAGEVQIYRFDLAAARS